MTAARAGTTKAPPGHAAGRRCVAALLKRELSAAWAAALLLAAAGGAYVALSAARAGLFGANSPARAAPLLQRLLDFPAAAAAAAAVAAALLGIARVNEDRAAGWLPPLVVTGTPAGAYPLALTLSVCAAILPIYLAAAGAFIAMRAALAPISPAPAPLLLQAIAAAAACFAACCYGAWVASIVRGAAAAAIVAAALYALPLVPALLIAHGGGEPGVLVQALAMPLPAPSAAADVELLARHLVYGSVALAGLIAVSPRLLGRWP